jgi:hypothetical protein
MVVAESRESPGERAGRRRALAGRAWVVPALLALVPTVALVGAAAGRPGWAVGAPTGPAPAPWLPTPTNGWFAAVFLALWASVVALYRWPRRNRPMALALLAVGILALLAAALGLASYLPCTTDGVRVLGALTGVVLLFVGSTESAALGPDAAGACAGPVPLAFQLARFLAIAATFAGATAVAFSVSRQQVDRLLAKFSRDVDVVTGLDATVLPLLKALVEERDRLRRRPDWYDPTWRERVLRRPRPRVVLVHENRTDPLLGAARALGALVLHADPSSPDSLRAVIALGRRVTLRRLFAVSADQEANLAVADAAGRVLEEVARASAPRRRWPREFVPRITVRFDDPREARAWRLHRLASADWFLDALSVDDLIARAVAGRLVQERAEHVVLAGDSPLTIALLDELAWRRWCWAERASAAPAPSAEDEWFLRSVLLVGDRADRVRREWEAHRAPCSAGEDVAAAPDGDWEEAADDAVARAAAGGAGRIAVVVTEPPGPDVLVRATRLAQLHPEALVVAPDLATSGVPADGRPAGRRGLGGPVVRYGPSLLQGAGPPEDSWTVLARQQHEWYARKAGRDGRAARRPWAEPGQPEADRLPAFFREENLRQHRHLLRILADLTGGTWRASHPGDVPAPLPASIRAGVVRSEHERWCGLREALGWRPPERPRTGGAPDATDRRRQALADERARVNASLVDWASGQPRRRRGAPAAAPYPAEAAAALRREVQEWNYALFDRIWARVFQWGVTLAPAPDADAEARGAEAGKPFRRRGEVRATRIGEATTWRTETGETMLAAAGDWWVEGDDGSCRTVASGEFARLYEPVRGDRYRRVGTVRARQVAVEETVATLEGPARALPGMWVVTDAGGNTWPVPDDVFRAGYEPAAG